MKFIDIVYKILDGVRENKDVIIFTEDDWDGAKTWKFDNIEQHTKIHATDSEGFGLLLTPSRCSTVVNVICCSKSQNDKIKKIEVDKKPLSTSRHVGVEIEFVSRLSSEDIKIMIAAAELEEHVTLKEDSSLEDHGDFCHTHEICILGTEKTISKLIKKVCGILSENSQVNDSCGLHVHLDMRNRNIDKAYANLYASQPLLYSMCPGERYESEFCYPDKQYVRFSKADSEKFERYRGINRASIKKHGTLEVRIHSGTINFDKINNWVKLLIKVADSPVKNLNKVEPIMEYKELKKKFKLRGKLEQYVITRIYKFKSQHKNHEFRIAA